MSKRRANSRSAKARGLEYLKKYPNAKIRSVANAANCSYNNAWSIVTAHRGLQGNKKPVPKGDGVFDDSTGEVVDMVGKKTTRRDKILASNTTVETPKKQEVAESLEKKPHGGDVGLTSSRSSSPISRNRGDVLCEAQSLVMTSRNVEYGDPLENHQTIAELATLITGKQLTAHDITMIQIATKLARMKVSPDKFDHYVDIAGYAGVAYECIED
jgi:hypothetical protein